MNVKVFISHQSRDTSLATSIARRLLMVHQIDTYLDVIDPNIKSGDDLAEHIRNEMGKCTQLLAVVSEATRASWWVPWEIGVASEKDYPLATYSDGPALPPEYLRKWPYLRSEAQLDEYAKASRMTFNRYTTQKFAMDERVARQRTTKDFFLTLRTNLGQL